ncbi:MAG: hypothetical protein AB7I04_14205 [Pseudomonadales bacterium]
MAVRLTQAMVDSSRSGGAAVRVKQVGWINIGTDRYVYFIVGRIGELSLKKARAEPSPAIRASSTAR